MSKEQQFEQMRKLTQTEAEQQASIQAITQATAKPTKNWAVSFIGTVSLIATCLLTFYLMTIDPSEPISSSPNDQSIEKIYYFTNANTDTFFDKWSTFYLHVGIVKDPKMLEQFEVFLQSAAPVIKGGSDMYDHHNEDILILYNDGTERRLKGFDPATFLDMETDEVLFIHTSSWSDFSTELFKNPNSDLGKVLGAVLLFFLPISITIWFKYKFPVIKRREWSLNWTHHLLSYLAIGLIWGIYTFWENKFGTFHIAAYAALWLLYGACQVAYRLKKQEHPRSIQLTIINHLIGTIALVLCMFGF